MAGNIENNGEIGVPVTDKGFKFSCIMAVYNVEEYLEEALESLLTQDIGFEDNIQIVLVDDGSTDGSGKMCDDYAALYPLNIVAIHKENEGPSSARNAGIQKATGEYITYVDPDDMLSKNTLGFVYEFFSENKEYVDVVCIPLYFFGSMKGQHLLNGKFKKGSRIINLNIESDAKLLSAASSFYKSEIVKSHSFNTGLHVSEDLFFNYMLFLNKPYFGVVADGIYHYRRRDSLKSLSLTRGRYDKPHNYIPYLKNIHLSLIETAKNKHDYIPKFLQSLIVYDLQWYIKQNEIPNGVLSDSEKQEFFRLLSEVFSVVDDAIIMSASHLWLEHKLRILQLKYNIQPSLQFTQNDIRLFYRDTHCGWLSALPLRIGVIESSDKHIFINGYFSIYTFMADGSHELMAKTNNGEFACSLGEFLPASMSLGTPTVFQMDFAVKIPICDIAARDSLEFSYFYNGQRVFANRVIFTNRSPLSNKYKQSYCVLDSWVIKLNKGSINLLPNTSNARKQAEKLFLKEIINPNEKKDKRKKYARALTKVRASAAAKEIWLISDRIDRAGDNGEALFRYVNQVKPKGIKAYFVIDKDCVDYQRLKKVGNVVAYRSKEHKRLHLLASKIISAHANEFVYSPLGKLDASYKDINSKKKFVFLQHGITKDDISSWLKRRDKNIKGFVTAASNECNSIIENENYGYSSNEVWLTGFPRFDRLYDNNQGFISIMPTWRKNLMAKYDMESKQWILKPGFLNSEYYLFYNKLINDKRLIEACSKNGYKILFYPHPNIMPFIDLFHQNDLVHFGAPDEAYRDIYAKSNLVLTDYSSAVFDFAYLRKPIVYAHFDHDDFFSGTHLYTEGYFDYERDGFGEVCYDLESTVDTLISYIENECQLKDKYRNRIDNFFAFGDKDNCKRVLQKIMDMDK